MNVGRIISTDSGMVLLNKKNSYLERAISDPIHTYINIIQIHSHHSISANHIFNHNYTRDSLQREARASECSLQRAREGTPP